MSNQPQSYSYTLSVQKAIFALHTRDLPYPCECVWRQARRTEYSSRSLRIDLARVLGITHGENPPYERGFLSSSLKLRDSGEGLNLVVYEVDRTPCSAHVKTHQSLSLSAFLGLLFNGNALEVFVHFQTFCEVTVSSKQRIEQLLLCRLRGRPRHTPRFLCLGGRPWDLRTD